jgi:acyl carrier protein
LFSFFAVAGFCHAQTNNIFDIRIFGAVGDGVTMDTNLEFLGRLDSQVKIRGFRIELGEVETVLRAQPEVREAVVVAREDSPGDKRLVAYLVTKTGDKPDVLTLRTRLAEKLPDYMIPAAFVWLDQLPLTLNGKLDRKGLPAPETNDGDVPNAASRPINLLELELIRIWQRLFQQENIDRRDNFFALGDHSLMAARLAVEIDKLFKCKLPIAALFQSSTVELLARRLTEEKWAPAWSSLVPLQSQGSKPCHYPHFFEVSFSSSDS